MLTRQRRAVHTWPHQPAEGRRRKRHSPTESRPHSGRQKTKTPLANGEPSTHGQLRTSRLTRRNAEFVQVQRSRQALRAHALKRQLLPGHVGSSFHAF